MRAWPLTLKDSPLKRVSKHHPAWNTFRKADFAVLTIGTRSPRGVSSPKLNEKQLCQQASAATILVILPAAGSQRAVFFRRCSLSFIISSKSATGRISIGPSPYLKPGSCELS